MKFVCDACGARYHIDDQKVRGKILRIRCKKCGHVITVREPVAPGVTAATSMGAPTGPVEWFYAVNGETFGPYPESAVVDLMSRGAVGDEAYVWNATFTDWLPAFEVAQFRAALERGHRSAVGRQRQATERLDAVELGRLKLASDQVPTVPSDDTTTADLSRPADVAEPRHSPRDSDSGSDATQEITDPAVKERLDALRAGLRERRQPTPRTVSTLDKPTTASMSALKDSGVGRTTTARPAADDAAEAVTLPPGTRLPAASTPQAVETPQPTPPPAAALEDLAEEDLTPVSSAVASSAPETTGLDSDVEISLPPADASASDTRGAAAADKAPDPSEAAPRFSLSDDIEVVAPASSPAPGPGGASKTGAIMIASVKREGRGRGMAIVALALLALIAVALVVLSAVESGTPDPVVVTPPPPPPPAPRLEVEATVAAAATARRNRAAVLALASRHVTRANANGLAALPEPPPAADEPSTRRREAAMAARSRATAANSTSEAAVLRAAEEPFEAPTSNRIPSPRSLAAPGPPAAARQQGPGPEHFADGLRTFVQNSLVRCNQRQVIEEGALEHARVEITITVQPSGRVTNLTLDRSISGTAFGRCLNSHSERWLFPSYSGASVTLQKTYVVQ